MPQVINEVFVQEDLTWGWGKAVDDVTGEVAEKPVTEVFDVTFISGPPVAQQASAPRLAAGRRLLWIVVIIVVVVAAAAILRGRRGRSQRRRGGEEPRIGEDARRRHDRIGGGL